jgi:serine protease inhibitor
MSRKRKFYRYHLFLSLSLVYGCQLPGSQTPRVLSVSPSELPSAIPVLPTVTPASLAPTPVQPQPISEPTPIAFSSVKPSPLLPKPTVSATSAGVFEVLSQSELLEVKNNALISANNRFAAKLFQTLAEEQTGNQFFSPVSVSLALMMAWNGAQGTTQAEMSQTLEISGFKPDDLNRGAHLLMRKMLRPAEDIQLEVANAIWANDRFELLPEFVKKNEENFLAAVRSSHFKNGPTQAEINAWVNERTHKKIPHVLAPEEADKAQAWEENTLAILANAIYFKANWTHQFETFETKDREFKLADGSSKTVPMMRLFDNFKYLPPNHPTFKNQFQAIQLPYGKKSTLGMYLFLPSYGVALPKIYPEVANLIQNPSFFNALSFDAGYVILPKFKFNSFYLLNTPLKKMGMNLAFDASQADFSKIAKITHSDQHFFISDIFQKANIEVNEEGTVAAAVTVITTTSDIGSSGPTRQIEMILDRPFMYLIRDNETGQILFMGTVQDPSQEQD